MKLHLILALAAFCIAPSLAQAQRGGDRSRGGDWSSIWTDPERREEMYERLKERVGEERAAEIRERMEAEYTKRFDTDGDGTVTDGEREAVVAKWQADREERMREWQERREIAKWDTDRDGKLSDEEKAAKEKSEKEAAEALKKKTEAMIKEYDADKDGELSPDEIKTMREKIAKMLTHVGDIATVAGAKARQGDNQYEGIVRTIEEARRGGDRGRDDWRRGGPPQRPSSGDRPDPKPGDGDGPPRKRNPLTGE